GSIFHLDLPWPQAFLVPLLLLQISVSTYFFGAFIGSIVLRYVNARNVVANVMQGVLMVIAGVNVPLSYLPAPARAVASVLPLMHGLQAVREVLSGHINGFVGREVCFEAGVMLLWLLVAAGSFNWFLDGGRRNGTIELTY
ncbi:MAG: type transport system permease protein, partial [Actinomycetota bacterium]